jgi:hypothetical protein
LPIITKSRPIIYLKSVRGTKDISWLYDTSAQATYLSEKLFRKISKEDRLNNNNDKIAILIKNLITMT